MENPENLPAFPVTANAQVYATGLTKHEWFAGMALQALIAKAPFFDNQGKNGRLRSDEKQKQFRLDMAASANAYADAMFSGSEGSRGKS